ncbi:hypothetical protein SAMN05216439_1780 [Methanobrevibacter gottschalkii]|uniref:Uncharacterized protein n=1 Tax=Methanobrevibacter gottschalkii TaxID=190974 RepID=A0A1H7LMB4_9EURY|nr:hypothetical protein [Methanobrevibacter gottschalkii]SEL00093.1 hypothetical protein SAMN05216439_1780 [Methanobrevibacter gottschalkii]
MMKARFYNDHEFLPTQEEETLLEVWEMGTPDQRKEFERDLEAEDSKAFQHFRDNVLVNHPEYEP